MSKTAELICPVCKKSLSRIDKSYRCESGHCFDIAKSGYVNLLLGSSQGKRHGDDKLMVVSRRELLNKGYYDPLASEIAACADKYSENSVSLLDAGCGEGKYTLDILNRLKASGKQADIVGIDISKDALMYAAKRSKEFTLAVASSAALPIGDMCTDIVLNIFSPFMDKEFHRVLKPDGVLIRVYPLRRHLWELKELIYDKPYENPEEDMSAEGFEIIEQREVKYRIHLDCGEDIMSLFKMTPYYYKTGINDQRKAEQATELDTALEFGIIIYRRK